VNKYLFYFYFFLLELPYFYIRNLIHSSNKDKDQSFLIIKLDAIGDFVLWLGACELLLTTYNQYKMTLVCNELCEELANQTKLFDKVIGVNRKKFINNLVYRFKVLRIINRESFRYAIEPTYSHEFLYGSCITRVCDAQEKIGFDCDLTNISSSMKRWSDRWYSRVIPCPENAISELERNVHFVEQLTGKTLLPVLVDFTKYIVVPKVNIKYYVLVPGAGSSKRCWPIELYQQLAQRIYDKTGWSGVVCGSEMDGNLGDYLKNNSYVPILDKVGKTNIIKYAEILGGAQMVIANESSAMHLAAALSVKSFILTGGGHFTRFARYPELGNKEIVYPTLVYNRMDCFDCNWQCMHEVKDSWPCIGNISLEAVWSQVDQYLDSLSARSE
jgi:ADP-heptose:LPS heptosyltransferase